MSTLLTVSSTGNGFWPERSRFQSLIPTQTRAQSPASNPFKIGPQFESSNSQKFIPSPNWIKGSRPSPFPKQQNFKKIRAEIDLVSVGGRQVTGKIYLEQVTVWNHSSLLVIIALRGCSSMTSHK